MKLWTQDEVWWGLLWAPNPPEDATGPQYAGGPGSAAYLYTLYSKGWITAAQLTQRVGMAWVTSRWSPFVELPEHCWAQMFDTVGLTINGWPTSKPPKAPVTLYRTAEPHQSHGWAWANELQAAASIRAHRSQEYNEPLQPIYRTVVPPDQIRCMIVLPRWTEYVIDTRALDIEDITHTIDTEDTNQCSNPSTEPEHCDSSSQESTKTPAAQT
jgi:hypothetical protein